MNAYMKSVFRHKTKYSIVLEYDQHIWKFFEIQNIGKRRVCIKTQKKILFEFILNEEE